MGSCRCAAILGAQQQISLSLLNHSFPCLLSPALPGAIHAVLYAPPGSPCWSSFHSELFKAAAGQLLPPGSPPVVYALRPLLGSACDAVRLAGLLCAGRAAACWQLEQAALRNHRMAFA